MQICLFSHESQSSHNRKFEKIRQQTARSVAQMTTFLLRAEPSKVILAKQELFLLPLANWAPHIIGSLSSTFFHNVNVRRLLARFNQNKHVKRQK